jgi:hypothetical protein
MWGDCVKRRAFKLFVFLLAGAIINVAVAWGSTFVQHRDSFWVDKPSDYYKDLPWPAPVPSSWPQYSNDAKILHSIGSTWTVASFRSSTEQYRSVHQSVLTSGVPLRTLIVVQEMFSRGDAPAVVHLETVPTRWLSGINVIEGELRLPLHPLWPGFAINTIFYAAIVWFLSFAPGAIRRRIGGVRRKRGQCAACGYSLQGTPDIEMCPECGNPCVLQTFSLRG